MELERAGVAAHDTGHLHEHGEIIGASPALVARARNLSRVAPTDATVLISGETGTGKELVRARHPRGEPARRQRVHQVQLRGDGQSDCARRRCLAQGEGALELANGGTLFLDEIGELAPDVQAKLLRVLQEQEFERVGSSSNQVDVRIIAATNRDLRKAVRDGEFREDLYYRLNVFPVELPPLRARVEDIPLLRAVLRAEIRAARRPPRRWRRSGHACWRSSRYPWPGNIRELENLVERALILNTAPVLKIPPEMLAPYTPDERADADRRGRDRHAPHAGVARSRRSISTTPKTPGCTTCSANTSCACSMPRTGSSKAITAPRSSSA